MKRHYILSILLALFSVTAFAQSVSQQQAKNIATQFLSKQFGMPSSTPKKVRNIKESTEDLLPYYMVESGNKVVIVAGDERMKPILGYFDTTVNGGQLPLGMQDLLADFETTYTQLQSLPVSKAANKAPRKAPENDSIVVEPLIKSTWGQEGVYNYMCPTYGYGTSVTGCVATAMAQVMNYHQYPLSCAGKCSYNTETYGLYVYLKLDGLVIDWPNIKDDYKGDYTKTERDAVANLMYYCGASVQMDYGLSESGSNLVLVTTALKNNFNYQETLELCEKKKYTTKQWTDMMNEDLLAGRPIIYASSKKDYSFGHAYVVDGVNSEGMYHINWGWDGEYNGYFALTSLQPNSGLNITTGQNMVRGIQPKGNKLTYLVDGKLYHVRYLMTGDKLPAMEAPAKEGYTFTGWENATETMPDHALVLNATYAPITYKVTFMVDDEVYATVNASTGEEIQYPELPTKEGYTFSGWDETPKVMQDSDIVISGTFSKNSYVLTYYMDGQEYHTETLAYAEAITPIDSPVMEGYTFSGWNELPATMPAHDVNVYGTLDKDDETTHPDYSLQTDILYIPDTTAYANTETKLGVIIKNSKNVVGFQFDLTIPQGATLRDIQIGRRVPATMTFSYKEVSEGVYKVLCYTTQKNHIRDIDGTVADLTLLLTNGSDEGNNQVLKMCNQVISFEDGTSITVKDSYTKLKVKNYYENCDVTLSYDGYATFYSSKCAYALPDGLSAMVVTNSAGNKLTYEKIADGSQSGIVPKGTAVMLCSNTNSSGKYTLVPVSENTTTYSGTNYLHGSDEACTTSASGSNYYYKLTYGEGKNSNIIGWYWGADNGAAFRIPSRHKAWLALPTSAVTRSAFFAVDEVKTIEDADSDNGNLQYYDLQGRSTSTPQVRGIYIVNGKKVLIKK